MQRYRLGKRKVCGQQVKMDILLFLKLSIQELTIVLTAASSALDVESCAPCPACTVAMKGPAAPATWS